MLTYNRLCISMFLLVFFLCSPAQAAKYYKWVDSEGVTHYGENPPDVGSAQVVNVKSGAPSDQDQAVEALEARRNAKTEQNSAEADPNAAIEAQNKEIMAKNCKIQRQNLGQIKANGRIKETDENGETRYLSAEEINARRSEIEAYLKANCENHP